MPAITGEPALRPVGGRGPSPASFVVGGLTRRYYRIRSLCNFSSLAQDGYCCVSADYDEKGKRVHLYAAYSEFSGLSEAARAMLPWIEGAPAEHNVVIDFYLWRTGIQGDAETTEKEVRSTLNQAGIPRSVQRIVAVVAGPDSGRGLAGTQHFTYRPSGENAYEEEKLSRGSTHDGQTAQSVATQQLSNRTAAFGGRCLPLPRRRPRQPER